MSPTCPIEAVSWHGSACSPQRRHAVTPIRPYAAPSRSPEIRFPDQRVNSQAFGFVFQDHAAGFQHIAVIRDLKRQISVLFDQKNRNAELSIDFDNLLENRPDQERRYP